MALAKLSEKLMPSESFPPITQNKIDTSILSASFLIDFWYRSRSLSADSSSLSSKIFSIESKFRLKFSKQ